jgi:hypothetical protein
MRSIYLFGFSSLLLATAAYGGEKDEKIPGLRPAAQKGLDYLVTSAKAWTESHKCYGCHVQAVTMEGLTVGRHHQYQVKAADLQAMVDALRLGVTAGGRKTGVAFQGAAWARYDQWIDGEHRDDLLQYARELLQYQTEEGAIEDDDRRPPVVAGTMQTTFQAMQTWRQAYARTADEAWLGPMRKAEGYLAKTARAWKDEQAISILDVNYALMGLTAAGMKSSEATPQKLIKNLLSRQNRDGGFGLEREKSDALATGQTLHALKLAGYDDRDPVIARGMRYLISKQEKDGSWRTVHSGQNGADKGEAMWAVLGLVSVDVTSIAIEGLRDGQRLDGSALVNVEATDHQSDGVAKLELFVDDLPVLVKAGASLSHRLSAEGMERGKHFIDVAATNRAGQTSRRRIEFYTGDVYLTHVGARFDEAKAETEISLRNIAPTAQTAGTIRLEVLTEGEKPALVFARDVKGEMGAMTIAWDGIGSDKKAKPRGKYLAKVSFVDAQGKLRQTEKAVFFHDSEKVQQAKFGEVEGRIAADKGTAGFGANAMIELVDEKGRVVQSTMSNEQGNYRFKSVDRGKYTVRARKKGFAAAETKVEAAPNAAPATADMILH